jgi:ribosomal-protein-alanine N-acetyltransferase
MTQVIEFNKVYSQIRWFTRKDMPQVLEIESKNNFAWTEEDFINALRQRHAIGTVSVVGDKVVGFSIYELSKGEIHLLNMAVHHHYYRNNIATQMIKKLKGKLSLDRRSKISLDVRETNLYAQLFFKSMDFKATHSMRNYYDDSGEDAFHMVYLKGGC